MPFPTVPANLARIALYMLREGVDDPTLFGVVPGSGTPETLNILNEDLVGDRATLRAELAKTNRLPGPLQYVGAGGENKALAIHLAPSTTFEALLEMLFCEEWATATITATTISAASADNSYNDSGNGFIAAGFVAGQTIKVSGFATADNNGRCRITSVTAGKIIVSGLTLVIEAATPSVTMAGNYLETGTKVISATMERHNTDLSSSNEFTAYPGVVFNQGTIAFEPRSLFTTAFQCHHAGPLAATGATSMPGAATAAANIAALIANASSHMSTFRVDGTAFAAIQQFSFTLNNNMSLLQVAGSLYPQWPNPGVAALTGNMRAYFLDGSTIKANLDAFTGMRISYEVVVPSYTHDYVFEVDNLKATRFGDFPRSGGTDPVMLDFAWEADESTTIADRFMIVSKVLK